MTYIESQAPVELWLVRHGETDWNTERRYQGHTDIPLNKQGRLQAQELAGQLTGQAFSAIYSSDLCRAMETAGILAGPLKGSVIADSRLREINMGDWEGRTHPDIVRDFPNAGTHLAYTDAHSRARGGESLAEVADRVRAFADETAQRHAGQIVLVVMHGLSLAALRCLAVGLHLAEALEMVPQNCQVVRIFWPHPYTTGDKEKVLPAPASSTN